MEITAARCRELFDYVDGKLIRRIPQGRQTAGDVAGTTDAHGYVCIIVDRRPYKRSRLIYLWHHGRFPFGEIDHINRVRNDDRIENLRDVSRAQNNWNHGDVRGYSWKRDRSQWHVRIKADGHQTHVGYFKTKEEARAAYLAAKKAKHAMGE